MTIKIGVAAIVLGVLAMSPAMAQTTAPGPAGSRNMIAETQGAPVEGRSESLSKKLSKSDGVITPKGNVDPGMKVPAPDSHPGTTPVIPPSATGGNTAK